MIASLFIQSWVFLKKFRLTINIMQYYSGVSVEHIQNVSSQNFLNV